MKRTKPTRWHARSQWWALAVAAVATMTPWAVACGAPTRVSARAAHRQPAPLVLVGYRQISAMNASSGAVKLRLPAPVASRLGWLVRGLPTHQAPKCMEDSLLYKLEFRSPAPGAPPYTVEGWSCEAAVQIFTQGRATQFRRDADCSLLDAVKRLVPAAARGTRSGVAGCRTGLPATPR